MANKVPSRYEEKSTVFLSNKDKKEVYRIPALFYDRGRRVLMAFAEKRTSSDDSSSEALVMKTGTFMKDETTPDSKIQWSEPKYVVEKRQLGGYRPMNPCPVYDSNSGTLFLFFICVKGFVSECWQLFWGCNKTRLCFVSTADGGQSWSGITDLTAELPEVASWATMAVGPGHGVQTGAGRLLVPVYAYGPNKPSSSCISCGCTVPRALSLYSDDGGANWQFGEMLEPRSLECMMAEVVVDGNAYVYCNARTGGGFRVEALSDSSGEQFTVLPPAGKLVETGRGCQGSVVSFPVQPGPEGAGPGPEGAEPGPREGAEPRWLLYSHPTSKDERVDLGLYLNRSPLDPMAWSQPWILNKGPSGYSDLFYLEDGWFACLMERGEASEIEQIACVVFSYRQLVDGIGASKEN
ncbi:sialidase-3-like isoform 2-T2 [Menidia menidia]